MAQEAERPAVGADDSGARPKGLAAVTAKPLTFSASNYKGQAEKPWPNPAREMRAIIAAHPDLTINGYAVRLWGAQEFLALTEPRHLQAFTAARQWLRQFPKLPKPNPCGSSHGLKHIAELEIGYLANGTMIAAAIAEGYPVLRRIPGTPNAEIGVSSAAWPTARRA